MSKTPEQMAEEHAKLRCPEQGPEFIVWCMCRDDFLAGYRAAKDKRAEVDKVMCNTTMKEIKAVDTGELMPITNLPTPAKWISVKERLPNVEKTSRALRRESTCVLIVSYGNVFVAHLCEDWSDRSNFIFEACNCNCRAFDMEIDEWKLDQVSHWMPLPEPPKEDK